MNNTICLYITLDNKYSNYFYKIFHGIDFELYYWDLIYSDIICKNDNAHLLFEKKTLNANDFKQILKLNDYYAIEVDMKLYKQNTPTYNIKNFNDFMKSPCISMFLLYDCCFVEFYCKDKKIMKSVYQNCIKAGFKVTAKNSNEVKDNTVSSFL